MVAKNKNHQLLLVFVAALLSFSFFVSDASAVTLGTSGSKFTVDGQAKFLVLVSYFDALDARNLNSDLDYLKSKGIDGIRILPNWWAGGQGGNFSSTALFSSSGNINAGQFNVLKNIITQANNRGMIVDVSFTRETVQNLSISNYKDAIEAVIRDLLSYRNVFYDFQNEANCNNFTEQDAINLRQRINSISSNIIISTSLACGISPSGTVNFTNNTGMDITNHHEDRVSNWWDLTQNITQSLLSAGKPVYLGEPDRYRTGMTSANFITAVSGAKRGGAAAWTFHTNAGFDLNGSQFQSNLNSTETDFLNRFQQALAGVIWGGGGGSPTPTEGNDPTCIDPAPPASTVPDMISTVRSVAASIDISTTCVKEGGSWAFMDELVRRLRSGPGGTKWAYNAKRSNLDDPWADGPSYYYGPGTAPRPGTTDIYEVFAIDAITSMCPGPGDLPSSPGWSVNDWPGNPATCGSNESCVAYLYPRTADGNASKPAKVFCSTTQPPPLPPPPLPADPPTISGINPTTTIPGQPVEVYGTNLGSTVRLTSEDDRTLDVGGSVDPQLTTTVFEVPADLPAGTYRVTITTSVGTATSPQNLTVRTGGAPFPPPVQPPIPTQGLPTDLGQLIQQIFAWSLALLGIAVFVMFFYAGFLWLTAAGNTARVGEAKTHMTNAVFGAILLLSSYLILYTINPDFVKNKFNLPGLGTSNTNQP